MSEIKIGVIGCGHWGPNHVRTFNTLPDSTVKACADLDQDRRSAVSIQFPHVEVLSDHEDLLNDDTIDAVVIATPTDTHYQIAKEALEKHKHVLCEKPLTLRSAEAEELVALAASVGCVLMVGHIFIFNSGILKLKEYINYNELGKLRYIHSKRTNLGPVRNDVNAMWDLASHDVSIMNFLLEAVPIEVTAKGMSYLQPEVEDVCFLTFTYPNNVIVNIHASWLDPQKIRQMVLVGDQKMASWDDMSATEPIRLLDMGVMREPYYEDFGQFKLLARTGNIVIPKIDAIEPLKMQAQHFCQSLTKGHAPVSDGTFSVGVVRALEAADASMKSGGTPQVVDQQNIPHLRI